MLRKLQLSGFFPKDALEWKSIGKHGGGAPPTSGMERS
jgi:hypothetical protein